MKFFLQLIAMLIFSKTYANCLDRYEYGVGQELHLLHQKIVKMNSLLTPKTISAVYRFTRGDMELVHVFKLEDGRFKFVFDNKENEKKLDFNSIEDFQKYYSDQIVESQREEYYELKDSSYEVSISGGRPVRLKIPGQLFCHIDFETDKPICQCYEK